MKGDSNLNCSTDERILKIWDQDLFVVYLPFYSKDLDPGVIETRSGVKSRLGSTNYSSHTYRLLILLAKLLKKNAKQAIDFKAKFLNRRNYYFNCTTKLSL